MNTEQLYYDDGSPVVFNKPKPEKKAVQVQPLAKELLMILSELKAMNKTMCEPKPKRSWIATPNRGASGFINTVAVKEV